MITSASLRHSPRFCLHCIAEFLPNRPRDIPPRKHGTPRVYNYIREYDRDFPDSVFMPNELPGLDSASESILERRWKAFLAY